MSLGCPKNLVDSEVMMGMLHHGGAALTPDAGDADIIVVNTCSFIDSAKQESVNTILEMAKYKIAAGGKARKLIVAGCLVERYRDDIMANIPEVDAVVGTGELEAILAAAGLTSAGHAIDADNPFTILTPQQAAQMQAGQMQAGKVQAGKVQAGKVQINRASSAVNQHSRPEGNTPQVMTELSAPASRAEGDARESAGRFSRAEWHGAAAALPTYLADEYTPRILSTPRASAYIKIAEGCDHPCTFCVIPQYRGKFRSRRFESVVAEATRLFANGVREINLIGQDTTCYGEDFGLKDGLATLLARLAQIETPLEKWVRFLYCYPNKVTQKLLDTIAGHKALVKYIDMPLQHASAPVLKRMKRGANGDIFLKLLEKIRRTIPGVAIRTSMIVGFPGETDADFEELCAFVKVAKFDRLGVFSYSDEDISGSFRLDGKVDARTIYNRKRRLMSLQRRISKAGNRKMIGREFDVLVEGPSQETDLLWEARLPSQAPEIDGVCYINDFGEVEPEVGEIRRIRITEAHDYDLVGELIDAPVRREPSPVLLNPFHILAAPRPQTAPFSR